jgi:hypothetical protein
MVDLTGIEPSAEMARKLFPPDIIGPTWQTNDDGSWVLPERTLGWEALGWIAENLTMPDGSPWIATDEQARIILWYYALDKRGRPLTRKGYVQRCKGHGKDPVAAALCLFELIGPCRFSHWDENGEAVGKINHSSWVQLVATTADQNKNTMLLLPSMLPKVTREKYNLEVNKQIIHVTGTGRRLESVSSNYQGLEGARPSFLIMNEPHHMTPSRGGQELFTTCQNNVNKVNGRMLLITNAYEPGQGSVAEDVTLAVRAVMEGRALDSGWFFDVLSAHPDSPLTPDWSPYIIDMVKGDSYWVDTEVVAQSLLDTSIPVSKLRRFFYNQVLASEDALITESDWDAIALWDSEDGRRREFALQRGDAITLGFDGGKTDDATALVAIRLSDRMVFPIQIWQKPEGPMGDNWRINDLEVDSMVHFCFRQYDVQAFFADVALWESSINSWSDHYRETLRVKATPRSTVGFDMRGNGEKITRANEALVQTIRDRKIFHNGDALLRRHVLNTCAFENQWGTTFRKRSRESPDKVDGYAAMLLAFLAMNDLGERGKKAPVQYDSALYQF